MKWAWGLPLLICLVCPALANIDRLYYPRPEANFDERTGYPLALLRLAFERHPDLSNIHLTPTDVKMPRGRALMLLEQGVAVDIFWAIASQERLQKLQPVKFPLYKGMFGYRLLLIRKTDIDEFALISGADLLRKKVAGLAYDWPDFRILKNNNFVVQGSTTYAGLFQLLAKKRVDYLPRSLFEIDAEQQYFASQGLVIEPNLALQYPVNFYYFVNKGRVGLADKIHESLLDLQNEGKTDLLFEAIYADLVNQSNLSDRTIFHLKTFSP
ncbi:MAG: hypothetical protein ACFHVJ_09180 [Aestuariibacter sp.]